MSDPGARVSVVGTRVVPPDPSLAQAIGRHHTMETAIADILDNSVDAGASQVHIRFVVDADRVESIRIGDDGSGMPEHAIDRAMTYAARREYGVEDLGHFGVGLKAASLSQGDLLSVFSRAAGYSPVGRRIEMSDPTTVQELDSSGAGRVLDSVAMPFEIVNGTVVEWSGLRNVLIAEGRDERRRWLDQVVNRVRIHLGIIFHRLIASGRIAITIDVLDTASGGAGVPRGVPPIDPFDFPVNAMGARNVELAIRLPEGVATAAAAIWPTSLTGRAEFRLFGDPGGLYQGFYFYRADRLLQIGGWDHVVLHRAELELVRVKIDVDDSLARHITINPEKSGLELDAVLRSAIEAATSSGGETFRDLLATGGEIRRQSRRYQKRDIEAVEPGRGFGPGVLRAFEETMVPSEYGAVDVRWRNLPGDEPVRVDLENRTIWLNARYRDAIAPDSRGEPTDAPFVKTLLLLLFSRHLEGVQLGAFEKRQIDAWQDLLSAALDDELTLRRLRERDEIDE